MEYKNISSKFKLQKKQNIKIPKYKFSYKDFYHEMSFQTSVKKYIRPNCLTAKILTLEKQDFFSIIRSHTVVRGGPRTPTTSTNGDIRCNS